MKNHSFALFSFFLFLFPIALFAQEGEQLSTLELPKVAPVSPEAASLGKYGDLPVNLATGKLAYSVPIFTINVNGYQLPISLSYNHGGLMAEEDAGVAGLGWTLNAGGRIIRQLRGGPDEDGSGYLGGNMGQNWVIPYNYNLWSASEREAKENELLFSAINNNWDLQPDKFILNAADLGGSFSYNEIGDPVFYPQKNYKVSKSNGNYTIINANGVIYDFGQKENTMGEEMTTDNPNLNYYTSSWGLSKITFPTNDKEITFSYTTNSSYVKSSFSDSKRVRTSMIGPNNGVCANTPNQIISSEYVSSIANKINISSISFPQGIVEFDIRDVSDGNAGMTSYLNAIIIKDVTNTIITKYIFEYDNVNSNVRLLQKIRKYGSNNTEIPFYSFEYYGTPPPNIKYGSQDLWGFYNGEFGAHLFSNDRSVDFDSSVLGALKKINYPTKGHTEINYESNRALMNKDAYVEAQVFTGVTPQINTSEGITLNATTSQNFDGSESKTIVIPTSQVISVDITTHFSNGNGMMIAGVAMSPLGCDPLFQDNNCWYSAQTSAENGNIQENSSNYSFTNYYSVDAGQVIDISATLEAYNVTGRAQIVINYLVPTTSTELELEIDNVTYINTKIGGIRVKSTSDCSSVGDCYGKIYKYNKTINGNETTSGQLLLSSPIYSYSQRFEDQALGTCNFKVYSSTSRIPSANFQGAPVLYGRVEVLQNGTESNGKSVLTFSNDINASPSFPFLPIDSQDWRKGNLLTKIDYANKNGILQQVSKTTNVYDTFYPFGTSATDTQRSVGMSVGQAIFKYNSSGQLILDANDLSERSSNNRPEFYHLTSSRKEINGISTITNYQYDAITGNLLETKTSGSDEIELKQKNYYAKDLTNTILIDQNRVSELIKTETLKQTQVLSIQNTEYTYFGNHYLPTKIQASKNNLTLEDRIIFHSYFENGLIKEVSKFDGTHIIYVYGYNDTQPIAKIENASYIDMSTSLNNAIIAAKAASNADIDDATEIQLCSALNALRNHIDLVNATMTSYTYDPLIGVKSITDSGGYTMYYIYDDHNRLKQVKDQDNNMLSENEYNYRPQN